MANNRTTGQQDEGGEQGCPPQEEEYMPPVGRRQRFPVEEYDDHEEVEAIRRANRESSVVIDPDASIAFNNRRRMAWLAMISMIALMIVLLFDWPKKIDNERLKLLQEPIVWFFLSMTAVIGSYMGFTSQIMSKFPGMKIGGGLLSGSSQRR